MSCGEMAAILCRNVLTSDDVRNTGELGPTENSAQAKTRPHGEVGPAENSAPRRTRSPTTAENSAPTAENSAPTEIPDQVLVW